MKVVCIDLEKDQKKKIKEILGKSKYIRLHSDRSGDFYIYASQKVYVKEKRDAVDITYAYKLKNTAMGARKWIAHLHYSDAKLFTLLFSKTKKQNNREKLKIDFHSNSYSDLEIRSRKEHEQYGRFYYQINGLDVNGFVFSLLVSVNELVPDTKEYDYKSADYYYDWS